MAALVERGGVAVESNAHALRWAFQAPEPGAPDADAIGAVLKIAASVLASLSFGAKNAAAGTLAQRQEPLRAVASVWSRHRHRATADLEVDEKTRAEGDQAKRTIAKAHQARLALASEEDAKRKRGVPYARVPTIGAPPSPSPSRGFGTDVRDDEPEDIRARDPRV